MACGCSSIRLQIIYFKKENYVDLYWHLDLLMGVSMTGLTEALLPSAPERGKGFRLSNEKQASTWRASMRRQAHSNLGFVASFLFRFSPRYVGFVARSWIFRTPFLGCECYQEHIKEIVEALLQSPFVRARGGEGAR